MSEKIVYLSGRIAGIPRLQATGWRDRFTARYPHVRDPMKRPFNEEGTAEDVKGIVEGDKADILESDVVLVYYDQPSVGTSMEILYAWENGKQVIVLNASEKTLSPWIRYHSHHIVKTFSEALIRIRHPDLKDIGEYQLLEPPDSKGKTLKFTCREYLGVEIYDNEGNVWKSSELKIGETILVPGLFGGFHRLVVTKRDTPTSGFATDGPNDQFGAVLDFGKDDRNCWICTGLANLKGVERVQFNG